MIAHLLDLRPRRAFLCPVLSGWLLVYWEVGATVKSFRGVTIVSGGLRVTSRLRHPGLSPKSLYNFPYIALFLTTLVGVGTDNAAIVH